MESTNLFCDVSDCGNLAQVFGLKGAFKDKSCSHHVALLTSKKMTIYDIAAYQFIDSPEDAQVFEERRSLVEKGVGNVTVIEARIEGELFEAQIEIEKQRRRVLELVQRCFEEVRLGVMEQCEKAKSEIQALKRHIEAYLFSKEEKLSAHARQMCEAATVGQKVIRFEIGDSALFIAKVICQGWKLTRRSVEEILDCFDAQVRDKRIESLISEAADCFSKGEIYKSIERHQLAKSLGSTQDFNYLLVAEQRRLFEDFVSIESLFRFTVDQVCIKEQIASWMHLFSAESATQPASETFKLLQGAWNLLQKYKIADRETAEVGLRLGEFTYLHAGKYPEGKAILRLSFEIEAKRDPMSEETMKLSNQIAAACFHSGRYSDAEKICMSVLQSFAKAGHHAEHYWTTLSYLSSSYWFQDKDKEASALLEEWEEREMAGENEMSRMMRLGVAGKHKMQQGRLEEAENALREAHRLGSEFHPTSIWTGLNLLSMGVLFDKLNRREDAETHFLLAHSIFEAVASHSMERANTLQSLGVLYSSSKRFDEAKSCFERAQCVYELVAPQSLQMGISLYELATLYEEMGNRKETIKAAESALVVLVKHNNTSMTQKANSLVERLHAQTEAQTPIDWIKKFFS